ncbi:MAG: hypothetical protein JXR80_03900 [Deltaproteobacteria bacterium]|nr:hypothetical protein [Deltaproteobacteria bacterium]
MSAKELIVVIMTEKQITEKRGGYQPIIYDSRLSLNLMPHQLASELGIHNRFC